MTHIPMTRPDLMLTENLSVHHHSAFVELSDGRILQASGRRFSISQDGGLTWSEPFQRRDKNGGPVGGGGSSLVNLDGNSIGLAAIGGSEEPTPDETLQERIARQERGRMSAHMAFWRSDDGGETWEAPVRVTPEGLKCQALHDVLMRTSSGRLVLPVFLLLGKNTGPYEEKPPSPGTLVNGQFINVTSHWFDPHGPSCVSVYYSDDDGRTWVPNHDGEVVLLLDWNATYSYVAEPTVTEVTPGTLLMLMRNQLGRLFQAWSYDNAETWTRPQPTSLAAGTTPAQVRTLDSGHILVVWNQEGEEDIKRGMSRQRMSSAISRNGGSVWEFFQNIESAIEGTRVEPGPIKRQQPEDVYFLPGKPAPERDPVHIVPGKRRGIWSYPSVLTLPDRVIVSYGYIRYEEHPTRAHWTTSVNEEPGYRTKIKVLPLNWFYGGKEPADNPFLPRAHEPASP